MAQKILVLTLLGIAAVFAVATLMHFYYLFSPPSYYAEHHGNASTARLVSACAMPILAGIAAYIYSFAAQADKPEAA